MDNRTIFREAATDLLFIDKTPWLAPWLNMDIEIVSLPRRPVTGEPFDVFWSLVLWARSKKQGYLSPHWLTFDEMREMGGCLKLGPSQKGTRVIADDQQKMVFNVDQCSGLPAIFYQSDEIMPEIALSQISMILNLKKIGIHFGGRDFFYCSTLDKIYIPTMFVPQTDEYWAQLFKAMIYWTIAPIRLDVIGGLAYQALVAEIGAAIMCARMGIKPNMDFQEDMECWEQLYRKDTISLAWACRDAQTALNFLFPQV